MSRSVTVAVAYIMSVTPLNWREALKVVRAGRAVANPNLGFQRQLQDFETYKLVEVRKSICVIWFDLESYDQPSNWSRYLIIGFQSRFPSIMFNKLYYVFSVE